LLGKDICEFLKDIGDKDSDKEINIIILLIIFTLSLSRISFTGVMNITLALLFTRILL